MLAQILAVMRKELRQAFRDRRMATVLLVAPLLQAVVLGYAVDLDVNDIRTAVCDQDHSAESRRLVDRLLADATLRRTSEVANPDLPLARGAAQAVVVIPRGFARHLLAAQPTQVQVLVDGTDPIRSQVTLAATLQFLQREGLRIGQQRMAAAAAARGQRLSWPMVRVEPRIYYNPRLKSPIYMVPAVGALTLLLVTTMVTAMGLAREKEMGTIEQLLITPMRPMVLLLGKTLPFAVVGLVVAGMVLAVAANLFSVPIRGSLIVLLVGSSFYLLTTLGTGVFIGTIARTQQQAILISFFFLLPAMLLSGFMSPIENMPSWVQLITWLNPVRYFVEVLRANLLKGAGFADLWPQLTAQLVFGISILSLAALRFRKQLA
jgi:ABC-2 type transport system permease protein